MSERVRRVVLPDRILTAEVGPAGDVTILDYEAVEEWREEPPTEEWGPWELVKVEVDGDPTYYPEHNRDGNLFRAPTVRALHPTRRRTFTWERKLFRRWVDRERGPMGQVVDVETYTTRSG